MSELLVLDRGDELWDELPFQEEQPSHFAKYGGPLVHEAVMDFPTDDKYSKDEPLTDRHPADRDDPDKFGGHPHPEADESKEDDSEPDALFGHVVTFDREKEGDESEEDDSGSQEEPEGDDDGPGPQPPIVK